MNAMKRVDVIPVHAGEGGEAMCRIGRIRSGLGKRRSNETPGGETARGEERTDG